MTSILDSYELRSLTLRNRIWIAPMCQYSVDTGDGVPAAWHDVHYGALAAGGTGLLVTEAAAVVPEGRISRRDVGIWNSEQVEAWRPIVEFAHSQGTAIGIQLAHAGAKASTYSGLADETGKRGSVPVADGGWHTVAPSDGAIMGLAPARALTIDEISEVKDAFVAAAQRSVDAGFDVVEVHGAHGYLLHEFLSPLVNRRTDAYGGGLANRARLSIEIVEAIRAAHPTLPIIVRLSATDWTDGGFTPDEAAQVSVWLREAGADLVDASSGGAVMAQIPVEPGYQVALAETVKQQGVPSSAVGLIETAAQAEAIVREGRADAIRIARPALRNPATPLAWARDLGASPDWVPEQYRRAY